MSAVTEDVYKQHLRSASKLLEEFIFARSYAASAAADAAAVAGATADDTVSSGGESGKLVGDLAKICEKLFLVQMGAAQDRIEAEALMFRLVDSVGRDKKCDHHLVMILMFQLNNDSSSNLKARSVVLALRVLNRLFLFVSTKRVAAAVSSSPTNTFLSSIAAALTAKSLDAITAAGPLIVTCIRRLPSLIPLQSRAELIAPLSLHVMSDDDSVRAAVVSTFRVIADADWKQRVGIRNSSSSSSSSSSSINLLRTSTDSSFNLLGTSSSSSSSLRSSFRCEIIRKFAGVIGICGQEAAEVAVPELTRSSIGYVQAIMAVLPEESDRSHVADIIVSIMAGILRLALQSSHASAISCISLDFAGAALAAVEPMELGQRGVMLLLQLLKHCLGLLQQSPSRADVTSACLRCISRSLQLLQVVWQHMGPMVLVACDGDESYQQQLSLPHMTCHSITVITQLLITSEDPLVLSSGLAAYAASCDAALRLSIHCSEPVAGELLSWMKQEGMSCSVMKVMLRCFYFPAVHTVCVVAMRAMKLICTSLLKHYIGSCMSAVITDIVFPMLQLVLDTSQRGSAAGGADLALECDQMKSFATCMTARLNCASTFPWLLLYARMEAGDCARAATSSSAPSSAVTASKLNLLMIQCLHFGESSIFALEPKTRIAAAECVYALTSSGWLGPQWLPHSRLFNSSKINCTPLSACESRFVAATPLSTVAALVHARVLVRLMQDMQPVKAMKHAAEYILTMHGLIVAEGQNFDSSLLLKPFFSFVSQCLTYFSELMDAPAVAEDTNLRCSLFRIITLLPSSLFLSSSSQFSPLQMSTVSYNIRSLAWNVCNFYFESKGVVLELKRAEDVSGFGDDLWNTIGGLGRGLEQKTNRARPLFDKAKRMSAAFANALRSSFHDIFASFRGGLLVAEASLCLRVLGCPAVLLNGDTSWLLALPDLCLSVLDVCPGPVFDTLADCMMTLGAEVFGPATARSPALVRVCKAAADIACNDDLDTGAAAARLLCRYFLAYADQPSPFTNNSSAVLDIANVVRQNFVDSAVAATDVHALGHYMALMAVVAALSDLPARDFEGLLQMFLSILQALSEFPDLIVALAQVNNVVCACRAVGPAGACLYDIFYSLWRPVLSKMFDMRHLHVVASMWLQVQEHKPELCSWLQSNFLSSLNEDGFAHAVVCVANIPHISAFTSLVLAHNRSITTLPSLLSLLHSIASTRSSAAASSDSLKTTKRNFAVASKSDPTTELCFNQDQAYLKACCVVIALAQFDISSLVDLALETTGFSVEALLLRNLPPLNHPLFPSFVRLIFQLIARDATIPDFNCDRVDAVVAAAAAAGSLRIQSMPLIDWSSCPPASAGGWQSFWRGFFQNVAAETSQSLFESQGTLKVNTKALLAISVLCAFDPMDAWLDVTQQQQQQLDERVLMNHFIGITCAAARVTRSLYNASKSREHDHTNAAAGRMRSGSGGIQRAAAASSLDANSVCLCWVDSSHESHSSAFSNPTSVCIPLGDAITFDAVMEACDPALVRSWWDAIASAYGSTPLIAIHLTRYMQRCRSTAGLCLAIQCAQRCLPTEHLVVCMHNMFSRHTAPYSELKHLVNRAAHAWDRAAKISESYSIRDTAVRDKYSMSSALEAGRDYSVASSSSAAATLAFQLAWLPSLDRERIISCVESACNWLMNPPCPPSSANDLSSADSCPPLRDLALAASSQQAHRPWSPAALSALLTAATSPRASLSNFMRCCYGPCTIPNIVREMRPADFAAFLTAVSRDRQMMLVEGVIGSACEACLPGLEMNANIAVVPLHLHYTLLGSGIRDVWLSGFVACVRPWIELYADSGSSSSNSDSNSCSGSSSSSPPQPHSNDAEARSDRLSPLVLLQIVKLMMFVLHAGSGGPSSFSSTSFNESTSYVLSSLVCVKFMKRFLRWVLQRGSGSSRSIQRDVDVILWILLQRNDLARTSSPLSQMTSSSPLSPTTSSSPLSPASPSSASASASASSQIPAAPLKALSFALLAPHPSIIVLRSLYYEYAGDTFTLDSSRCVSVRPSVLLALRRGCHDQTNLGYSRSYMRVCVGRMIEALMIWGDMNASHTDDDNETDSCDNVCVDTPCLPWYPAPILPLAACHHPAHTLDLLRHLLTRIDFKTLAASGLQDFPRPPAPRGGWMPETTAAAGGIPAEVDRDWLVEQQEIITQVVECVAAAVMRYAPFNGGQTWQNSSTASAASSASASCMAYISSLTCGHVRVDCTSPCSLDACDVTSRVLFAMKQPKQPAEMESITAHALLLLYLALVYQGPLSLALRSVAAVQLLRLSQHIRVMSHFHWLKDFSSKLLSHCTSRDDMQSAAPLLSCASAAAAVIQECQKVQAPSAVMHALPRMTDSSIMSHRLNAIACVTALVEAGFVANLASLSSLSSSSSVLEAALVAPWESVTHLFADAPNLQRPPADPSYHACIAVAKLYKAVFACKKHLKSSPRLQASVTRSFHEFFRVHVLRPSVPLQLMSYVIACVYAEGGERVRCMLEGQCDIVAGCGMRRMMLLCDGAFCRWPALCGADGGAKDLLPDECTQLLAKLRTTSPLETAGVVIVCRSLLQQLDLDQRAMLMLGEALNDGSSASFEGVALLIRNFVDGGDVAFRNVALRMCVNVMMVERDSAHRRVGSSSSSSTAIPRAQLIVSIVALSNSRIVRFALESCVRSSDVARRSAACIWPLLLAMISSDSCIDVQLQTKVMDMVRSRNMSLGIRSSALRFERDEA